ncbi:hypothetical protein EJ110_NYTH42233, partial [Nymphaea thermarum]
SVSKKLSLEKLSKIKIVGKDEVGNSLYGQVVLGKGVASSLDEHLENIVATLRAGAESAGLPVDQCVLVAGSLSGALAAERIGMPCVLLRSRVTSRAEFPTTATVMEGFGGSDLTVFKLQNKKWSSSF